MIKEFIRRRFLKNTQLIFLKGALSGHFYSSIPLLRELPKHAEPVPRMLPGIDLKEDDQLRLLRNWIAQGFYKEMPFPQTNNGSTLYSFEDPRNLFMYADAVMLYCMLRHSRPKRLIEVGCGSSTFVTLDTNRLFFSNAIQCTFIDPYPPPILDREQVITKKLQDIPLETFARLESGDILFIDSSHVSKIGSDVNYIFFHILPAIKPGVRIHFHDIQYPFEYPLEWIGEGKSWTEAYILRTFLQFNSEFDVELWCSYLMHFHREFFQQDMPMCLKDPGGSIWIRRH